MLQTLGTKASGILLNFQKKKLSLTLAFAFLQLVSHLPSNPAWHKADTEFCLGFHKGQPGFAALAPPCRSCLATAGGTHKAVANPTKTLGQLSRGKMVASREGAGQHGPLRIAPHPSWVTLPEELHPEMAGRRGGGDRGYQGEPPGLWSTPTAILPGSRGLSALGGSVGTSSSRCFVLVHLGVSR